MHILIFGRDNTYGWCCIASPVRLLGRKDIDLHRNTRCFFVLVQEFVCIHCFFLGGEMCSRSYMFSFLRIDAHHNTHQPVEQSNSNMSRHVERILKS